MLHLVLSFLVAVGPGCAQEDAQGWFKSGQRKFLEGNLDGAIADFGKAMELDPDHKLYPHARGKARLKKRDFQGALDDLKVALRLDPGWAEAYLDEGIVYYEWKRLREAAGDFDEAIELDPKLAAAWHYRGLVRIEHEEYDKAIADFTKAVELDPKFGPAFVGRARARSMKDDDEGAVADCTRALEINPKDASAYLERGKSRYYLQKYSDVVKDLGAALAVEPNLVEAYYFRGLSRRSLKEPDAAIDDFTNAIRLDKDHLKAYYWRAVSKFDKGDYDGAVADGETARGRDIYGDYWPYNIVGLAKKAKRDYKGAWEEFELAVLLDSKNKVFWANFGDVALCVGDYGGAIGRFSRAIAIDRKYAWALSARANAWRHELQREKGLADAAAAVENDPKWARPYCIRGYLHFDGGSWKEALADFEKSLELDKSNGYLPLWIWMTRMRQGDKAAADQGLKDHLSAMAPADQKKWRGRIALMLSGELSEDELLKEAETEADMPAAEKRCEAFYYVGSRRLIRGDQEGAADLFRKCLETKVYNFDEMAAARAELARMKK